MSFQFLRTVLFVGCGIALLATSELARAQATTEADQTPTEVRSDSGSRPEVRVALLVVGGVLPFRESHGYEPQGVGLGIRTGLTLASGAYVGTTALGFLGTVHHSRGHAIRDWRMQVTFDVGRDFRRRGRLVWRPTIAIGLNRDAAVDTGDGNRIESELGFVVAPGIELLVDLPDHLFIAASTRTPFVLRFSDYTLLSDGTGSFIDFGIQGTFAVGARF